MPHPSVHISVFGKTDLGRTRDHNEDTFLVADLTHDRASLQAEVREHDVGERGSLFVVADGMGGAAAGELASAMAADLIHSHLATVWTAEDEGSVERFAFRLREAVVRANARIHAYANQRPELKGMGTTATAAGVLGTDLVLAQVGDSRAYLVRHGEAVQLTKDQSLTQRLVDAGELTEEEAQKSERRNIILQALGPEPNVSVELTHEDLRHGDVLVLCSDGLSGNVTASEIAQIVSAHQAPADVCGALIDIANERGGPDNITVVVARFTGAALREPGTDSEPEYHVMTIEAEEEAEEIEDEDTASFPATEEREESLPLRRGRPPLVIPLMIAGVLLAMLAFYFAFRR